jgi:hypothetical protein
MSRYEKGAPKWGKDRPLTYWTGLELLAKRKGIDPKKGRSLNWGGLRIFGDPENDNCIPYITQGCVTLVHVHPHSVVLNPDALRTKSALAVCQAFSPIPLKTQGQNWFLRRGCGKGDVLFADGMRVFNSGRVSPEIPWNRKQDPDPAGTAWVMFERYVAWWLEQVQMSTIPFPDASSCWTCYSNTSKYIDGHLVPRGAEFGGVTHLFQHMTRKEIEPGILWRALHEGGLSPQMRWDTVVGSSFYSHDLNTARDVLTAFFRRRLGALGSFHFRARELFRERTKSNDGRRSKDADCNVGEGSTGHAAQPSFIVSGV